MLLRRGPHSCNLRNIRSCSDNGKNFKFESNILKSVTAVDIPRVDVSSLIWRNIKNWELKPALTCGETGRSYSYGQLQRSSENFGTNLRVISGLREGEKLGLVLPNIPEFATAFYGAASAGLISTLANPIYTKDELAKQFVDTEVSAVVTTQSLLPKVRSALKSSLGGGCIIVVDGKTDKKQNVYGFQDLAQKKYKGADTPKKPDPEAPVVIPYSSGTTGLPKGVVLTHGNLVAAISIADHPDVIPQKSIGSFQEVTLAAVPLFHIYGLVNILGLSLFRGYYIVTLPNFEPKLFANTFSKHKPSYMCFVPPLMSFVASSPLITRKALSHLTFAANAAAPLSKQLVNQLKAKSGNSKLIVKNGFGMTETSALATITPGSFQKETVGLPGPNTEVKVVDDQGLALPMGQVGELCVRGPQVMKGYLNNEKATTEVISEDDWLATGDIGYIDPEDGHINLVDRKKDLIKVKGFQVSPTELELLLLEIDGVADAAVIGVPNQTSGELPKAFIVKKADSNVTEQDVIKFVEQKVAPFKQLKGGVMFVSEIPKSAAGKTLKTLLADNELK
ncbi:Hypothetical predicted protein [Cloeon dipterum]|uniref:AMP-dependent synthetase/ligase domain-containing protein n=1 Tax=Cloeon dipterum TaxID=197152 RepID=A0A8S1C7F3_9INSE|nr:Hypothetical predicted protein [Cloeon dipterum]